MTREPIAPIARRKSQFSLGCLLKTITGISILLGIWLAATRFATGEYILSTIDCDGDRRIVVTAERSWEMNQGVFYEVYSDGNRIVPATLMTWGGAGNADQLRFGVQYACNREVVGLFERSNPSEYLVIHDFRDNASWPCGEGDPRHRGSGRYTRLDLESLLRGSTIE